MNFIKYIFQFFPSRLEFKIKPIIAVLKVIALVLVGLAVGCISKLRTSNFEPFIIW
jgi:hypothetical protein